jgi:c-di-GMP-binding flagellar brake protein YcgR
MTEPGIDMLTVGTPVLVRVASQHDQGHEYSSRIDHLEADSVAIVAPSGASAALLASGSRDVQLSWLSLRGRYEQHCELVEHVAASGRLWRLRPTRRPVLIQRRRYVRVTASVPVRVFVDGEDMAGTTVDVSEGGFRVRVPRRTISELAHTTVQATLSGAQIAVPGYVLRSTDVPSDETEAVIAFQADGGDGEAIRRFILNTRLRAGALNAKPGRELH